jgi:hypothetical protein
LIRGPLRASIGRIKIQRPFFADTDQAFSKAIAVSILDDRDLLQPAINFISGRENDHRPMTGKSRCVQNIQCPECVDVKIRPRIRNRCRDRHLASEMVNNIRTPNDGLHSIEISYIRSDEAEPRALRMALQPSNIMSGARSQQRVEHCDVLSRREQVAYQIGADEAGTACDERTSTHAVSRSVRHFPHKKLYFRSLFN